MKTLLFSLVLLLTLSTVFACKERLQPGFTLVKLDQVFELSRNNSVQVKGEDLKLTFSTVMEDSRCPEGVNCIQEGQVRVMLALANGGKSMALEFARTASQKGIVSRTLGHFNIQLSEVSPYPKNGEKIKPEAYKLKLAISKSK